MLTLKGILPALVTPFDDEGNINLNTVRDLIEFHLARGVSGFYLLGGTGEGLLLTEAERRLVAETAIDQIKGRVPAVVHVGALTTRLACDLAAHAEQAGADAISSVPPFYYRVGAEGVKQHYTRIGAASNLPFYIYNIPGTTGVDFSVDLVTDLIAEMPTLRGMKYTSHNFFLMRQIIELDGGHLNVVSGPDEMMIAALSMGADGSIGSTHNALPGLFLHAYQTFRAGDVLQAEQLQAQINHIVSTYFNFSTIAVVKEMMRHLGFDCGSGRRPNLPLTDEQKGQLREQLEEVGFFDLAARYSR